MVPSHRASRGYGRAERLLDIVRLLDWVPLGSRTLLERLELPEAMLRTVQRDLTLLCERGKLERLEDGRYRPASPERSKGGFNALEAVAVYSLARVFYQQAPEYSSAFDGVMSHLSRTLPESLSEVLGQARERYRLLKRKPDYHPAYLRDASRTLEKVAQAWLERRHLHFDYRSSTAQTTKRVELALYGVEVSPHNHFAYAIGRDRLAEHGEVRVYRVGRMVRAEVGPDPVKVPQNFDLHTFFEHAWGVMRSDAPVVVVLDFVAEAIERVLEGRIPCLMGAPQQLPGGGLRLTLKVGHTVELEPWIRGWGALVQVVEPLELRARTVQELRRTLAAYES